LYLHLFSNYKNSVNNELETFYPKGRKQWRQWLKKHHARKQSIWLICYKKKSNIPTVSWSEAVDEALCFGWIDSQRRSIDDEKFMQYFCRRKQKSSWSKINKAKVQYLIEEGLMTQAGFDSIEIAKNNGSWATLDEVQELKIPADLNRELRNQIKAKKYFLSLSRSDRRNILQWLVSAKRQETRLKRIAEIVELGKQNQKPKQFR
jgi:uncharacterized protein YdeI (YjbR/CyaY-like superfamily)